MRLSGRNIRGVRAPASLKKRQYMPGSSQTIHSIRGVRAPASLQDVASLQGRGLKRKKQCLHQ